MGAPQAFAHANTPTVTKKIQVAALIVDSSILKINNHFGALQLL